MGKTLPKTVETSQPPLNVLPVFIITEQTVLVQSVYVKQRSLLSLHLVRTLEQRLLDVVRQVSNCYDSVLSVINRECKVNKQAPPITRFCQDLVSV